MRTPLPGQLEPMRPRGPQCFVDWRYVKAGFVGWYAGRERIGVWEPAAPITRGVPRAPSGIRLEAQPAEVVGPIMPPARPWEYASNLSTIIYDGGVYRAWYECIPGDHFTGQDVGWSLGYGNLLCYAESDDGFEWRRPNLGIANYHGETNTNIVYGRDLSPNGLHGGGVFIDSHAPADERYKLIYMGIATGVDGAEWRSRYQPRFGDDMDPMSFRHSGEQSVRMLEASGHLERSRAPGRVNFVAGAVSPDGLHWTGLPEPLMVHFSDTLNTASWDPERRRYVGYFRTWLYGRRCVGRAETEDFRHWPATPDTVLQAPLDAHPSDDVYTNAKVIYPNSGDTHLMFPGIYHRLDDSREVRLASSVEGIHWQWVPGDPVIPRGPTGTWYGADLTAKCGLVPLSGDRIGVSITGHTYPHKYPRGSEPFGHRGWAVWPKGRLSALCADEQGEFATPGLVVDGRELSLNVDTRHAGEVLVEIQDEAGQPIEGYTFADADSISTNSLDHRVTWRGNASLPSNGGRPISLAVSLRQAKLFAFEFVG